jgi:hypothetical protein
MDIVVQDARDTVAGTEALGIVGSSGKMPARPG